MPLQLESTQRRSGVRVTFLHDGREAYPAMLKAIREAERTVHLEVYVLRGDATGRRFARALENRVKAGVDVRIVYDVFGSRHLAPDFIARLKDCGIRLLAYRPLGLWNFPWGWWRRTHRKLLIVDGRIGFAGGINISDEYADPREGGDGWRDVHARVEGPAVSALEALFVRLWNDERPEDRIPPAAPARPDPSRRVRVVANNGLLWRDKIHQEIVAAVRGAERSITILMGYFLPGTELRSELYAAARRGVTVRLLAPTRSPIPILMHAGQAYYKEYLRNGLHLYRLSDAILHAKAIVVDRSWCAVGSFNITARSRYYNLEANLHIRDGLAASQLEDGFEVDFRRARRLRPEEWDVLSRRSPWHDRLCYAFRALY